MKVRGKCCREIKNPKKQFFNRPEPLSRERIMEERADGVHNYKQSLRKKDGLRIPKSSKL